VRVFDESDNGRLRVEGNEFFTRAQKFPGQVIERGIDSEAQAQPLALLHGLASTLIVVVFDLSRKDVIEQQLAKVFHLARLFRAASTPGGCGMQGGVGERLSNISPLVGGERRAKAGLGSTTQAADAHHIISAIAVDVDFKVEVAGLGGHK
jgi:hypothetical protein